MEFDPSQYTEQRIQNNLDNIARLMNSELIPIQKRDLESTFNEAIDDFYETGAAFPRYYRRKSRGLKNTLVFNIDDVQNASANFDHTQMEIGKRKNESYLLDEDGLKKYVFDTAFGRGYHGGADKIAAGKVDMWGAHPSTGTPYYRTKSGFRAWGEEALSEDMPPFERIKSELEKKKPEYDKLAAKLFAKYAIQHILD